MLKIDEDVTGEAILCQVLQHLQLPYSLIAKNPNEGIFVVDPTEYSIAIKFSPPAVSKPRDRAICELLKNKPYVDE